MKPVVALIGRPNVGKSTLFNRLVGERAAIVDDVPGTTRDRLLGDAEWNGRAFHVMDTGGIDPTHGGKTPLSVGSAEFIEDIRRQAGFAIEEADAIIFVNDAESGVTEPDLEVAKMLRRAQKKQPDGSFHPPVFVAVNKCENEERRLQAAEFYQLGLGEPYPISAIHGTDVGDLLDALVASFPAQTEEAEDESVKIAIVGKPNAGKSSLLNRLAGEERVIVSPIAGTTRDSIDTKLEYEGIPITLIDTAGIRKRGKIDQGVEQYSVIRAFKSIERADVALLVIDAAEGITAQDAHIAGYILEEWKSCVVLVNKWDAVEKTSETMDEYVARIRHELNFMDYVPILFISCKTGQRVEQVIPMALRVQEERLARLSTSTINKIIHEAQDAHPHPTHAGRALKMYYGTQVRSDPPTFMIYVNEPSLMHFTYLRYLENQIRAEHPFIGTPIRLVVKGRREE